MAMSGNVSLLLCLVTITFVHQFQSKFLLAATTSSSSPPSRESKDGRGKIHSFTLYQQETINKTAYTIVDGVAGPGVSLTTTPFGTIYIFRDDLMVHAGRTSPVASVAEGTSITSNINGLRSLSLAKISVHYRSHWGLVSILRGTNNTKRWTEEAIRRGLNKRHAIDILF